MLRQLISAIALVGAVSCQAHAHDIRASFPDEVRWIEVRFGRSIDPAPIMIVNGGFMRIMAARVTPEGMSAHGLYTDGVIMLDDDFDVARDREIIVHELVHHVQWLSGQQLGCEAERLAYTVQNEWRAERGLPAYADPDAMVRACEGAGHRH